jgi:hypothetical protein
MSAGTVLARDGHWWRKALRFGDERRSCEAGRSIEVMWLTCYNVPIRYEVDQITPLP